jgi:hypothetical protein
LAEAAVVALHPAAVEDDRCDLYALPQRIGAMQAIMARRRAVDSARSFQT